MAGVGSRLSVAYYSGHNTSCFISADDCLAAKGGAFRRAASSTDTPLPSGESEPYGLLL